MAKREKIKQFLPVTRQDMLDRDWYWYDFLMITADAYVDHPSFGAAVISRVLEDAGYRVCMLSQPNWRTTEDFMRFGKPRFGVFISGGNLDSMVAHYTSAKKRRSEDLYSPGRKTGLRPDRATIVYANKVREAYGDIPIIIGGLEASLRRFAHYDYWEDKVRHSILFDAQADLISYGMGEHATLEIAAALKKGTPISEITNVRGTAYAAKNADRCAFPSVEVASFEAVQQDKVAYARANQVEYDEHDPIRGRAILQRHGDRVLVVNPPAMPLTTPELDHVAELPYMRLPHPMYDAMGGVPAIEEVRFSVTHNRGCIGACSFCAIAFHQGRMITCRSEESILREVEELTQLPDFKGYIHDVGGPTANFRHPSCQKQLKCGMCKGRNCLAPEPCPNLDADESDYLRLLRRVRAVPGVKKVFVRSGIRFDYMLQDKSDAFFRELVQYHVSGQLKVAPEHCIDSVLDYMGKPHIEVYERFQQKYNQLNARMGKEQFLVPYLMSSHPGSTLQDAVALAEYLNSKHRQPEQVQDFYPTPGTLSTCMYYTELDPRTMKPVYVAKTPHDKALQRALLQWKRPEKRPLVLEALKKAGRTDLIGYRPECLIRPKDGPAPWEREREEKRLAKERAEKYQKNRRPGSRRGSPAGKSGPTGGGRNASGGKAASGSRNQTNNKGKKGKGSR
jgi:uncharacterized radical SAM protein YgiQ